MNDKNIRPALREWIESEIGGHIEEEITASGYRLDLAVLGDFITGFEIKGDNDSINCPHFREQIVGYSRVCRKCWLVLTTNRPKAIAIASAILPWYWGIIAITSTGITVQRQACESPDLILSALLDGLHKRELSGMIKPAAPIKKWERKDKLIGYLSTQVPTRRAEALLARSLRSSNFRFRNRFGLKKDRQRERGAA